MTETAQTTGHNRNRWLGVLRRTPLHPQWLLPGRASVVRCLLMHAHGVVLDVGCADRWVETWLPAKSRYVGIDYPGTGVALYGAQPDLLADASRLPIADGVADTVLLLDVLEHLRYPQQALAECARVLRPGGRLLLAVPFLYPVHDAPHDYQRLTTHGLDRDVRSAGFDIEACGADTGPLESAALLANLSLAGTVYECWCRRSPWLLLAPLLLLPVPLLNVVGWAAGKVLPRWNAMTLGYSLVARRS